MPAVAHCHSSRFLSPPSAEDLRALGRRDAPCVTIRLQAGPDDDRRRAELARLLALLATAEPPGEG